MTNHSDKSPHVIPFAPAGKEKAAAGEPTSGQELSLTQLFHKYSHALKIFVRSAVKDPQIAEEITQETYLRLLEKQRNGEVEFSRAYLFRTAQNLAIDCLRRGALNVIGDSVVIAEDDVIASTPSPEELTTYAEAKKLLNQSLAELPVDTSKVFYYRRYRNWAISDISEEMGISERMVYKHMGAALKHLAGKFGLPRRKVQ